MEKETNEFPKGSIQKETKPNNKRKVVFWSLLASGVGVIIIVALLLIFLLPKEEKYEIELSSNVSVEGEVLTGDGSYKKGESITIVAEEITGYRFTGWSFNGNIISTDKEYNFIIGEDTEGEYTANYDKLYSISVQDVHNSVSIMGNKTQAIEDEKVEFTITPNSNYRIIEVKVNDDTLTESNRQYTFNMPAEDVTITVTYAEEYAITIDTNSSEYVQIEKQNAIAGENVEFTVSEKVGYRVIEVKYNETTLQSDSNTYSFNMPAEDVTIIVTYAEEYAITIDSSVSDMVTSVSLDKAISGEQVVVTANIQDTVTEDYVIMSDGLYYIENGSEEKVTINQIEGQYSFTMPANDITIGVDSQSYRRLDDFTFDGNSITDYTGSDSELTLPAYYETVDVNSQNYTIEKDTGTEIAEIGEFAFQDCTSLSSIVIPSEIVEIGMGAFYNCTNLQTVDFGDKSHLQIIDEGVFASTGLINISIPSSVTTINAGAFSSCENLTSITIPEGVTSIGDSAFDNCTNLQTVDFGENSQLQTIGNSAFSDCTSLQIVDFGDNSQLQTIDMRAFYNCTNLQSVDFGENSQLQTIGTFAFEDCTNLTSITIPASVTSIDYGAFLSCYELILIVNNSNNFIVTNDSNNGYVGNYAYEIVNKGETVQGRIEKINEVQYYINDTTNEKIALSPAILRSEITNIILVEGTTAINQYAFSDCINLQTVDFGDNSQLKTIGDRAFFICTNLQTVDFGENSQLQLIGDYAFGGCTNLTTVNFGDNSQLQSIGDDAFQNCTRLSSITIPASVTTIGSGAFSGCTKLTSVTIESDDIYNAAIGTDTWSHAGGLLANATTVKVLKTIVDGEGNVNDYLNNESNFTKTTQGANDLYYTYTKINNI